MIIKNLVSLKNTVRFGNSPKIHTSFDGLNESTEIPDIAETNGVSKLTISYWFVDTNNFTGRHGGKYLTLASWIETNAVNGYPQFTMSNSGGPCGASPCIARGEGTTLLNLGQWYHFVGVFDGTQTGDSNRMQIYIDGVRETLNFPATEPIPATTPTINQNWRLGVSRDVYGFFGGGLDEYSIWGSAWTQAQVTQVYNSGRVRTDYGGITGGVARWKMDTLNPVDLFNNYNGTSINQDNSNIIYEQ